MASHSSAIIPPKEHSSEPRLASIPTKDLLESTIEFAYAIARIHCSLANEADAFIRFQMQRPFLNSNPTMYHRAKAWCDHYAIASLSLEPCVRRIHEISTQTDKAKLLEFAFQIGQASGPLEQRAIQLIERTAKEWGIVWKPNVAEVLAEPLAFDRPIPPEMREPTSLVPNKQRMKERSRPVGQGAQSSAFLDAGSSSA